MKKFLIIIFAILSTFFMLNNYSFALSAEDFGPALNKKISKMKTPEEKVKFLQTFADLLTDPVFTKDKNARFFADLRNYTLNMIPEIQSGQSTTTQKVSNLPHLSNNFSNIDEQKVRDAILSRHNEERNNVWVNSYIYNLDLEWSATTRATKLADSHKTSNLHLRNSWDWYYNYNSILNRFSDLWINFPASVKWASSFSESIWYWSYKCSKSDCTQDLITAIKKTWTGLIMKEKNSNGSHYKAATMKHFTQMWVWIAIDKSNNRYYLVLHYGVNH